MSAVVVEISNLPPLTGWIPQKLRHAGLFLLCGAALGFTLGDIIKDPAAAMILEWAWLAFAVVAVAIHYSPSDRDSYSS